MGGEGGCKRKRVPNLVRKQVHLKDQASSSNAAKVVLPAASTCRGEPRLGLQQSSNDLGLLR
jgi:hypothetical protein